MNTVAFDTETYPIMETRKATHLVCPRMVCLQTYDGERHSLKDHEGGAAWFVRTIRDTETTVIGHNVAFDLAVGVRAAREFLDVDLGEEVWRELKEGRVWDTMLNEKLQDIYRGGIFRRGGYSLANLVERHLGEEVEGKDDPSAWRTRYNELFGRPIDTWPKDARDYAINDAKYTYRVAHAQDRHQNEQFQVVSAFALHLITCRGMRVDEEYTYACDNYYAKREDKYKRQLEEAEIIIDDTLKRAKQKELVADAWEQVGEQPNLTDKGNIKTDKDTLRELEEKGVEDPLFEALISFKKAQKFRSTYLEPLLDAADADLPLCPRYHTIVNTGRTSSSGPNIQNFPSRHSVDEADTLDEVEDDYESTFDRVVNGGVVTGPDLRGCLVPRDGKVLVSADYSSLEMVTLAQVITNFQGRVTTLGEAINDGKDLHLMVAATITGEDYETCEAAYEAGEKWIQRPRQVAKVVNYSRPVGAGAETIQGQLRQQGVSMTLPEIEEVIAEWNKTWPDMEIFRRQVEAMSKGFEEPYWVEQHGPNRMTKGWRCRLVEHEERSSAMNSLFQGLAADGAKFAGVWLVERCKTEAGSPPLYNHAEVWAFIHDEYVLEVDEGHADECGPELSRLMEGAMDQFCPDIDVEAEWEVHTERWSK